MMVARLDHIDDVQTLSRMPSWVSSLRGETVEDMAFLSGAALSHLCVMLANEAVPRVLLRDRLALQAAEACVVFSGRPERAGELRDTVQFLRPGDLPGPAGESYLAWRRAVERPVSGKSLGRALTALEPSQIATWFDLEQGMPITRAAIVLEAVLMEVPRFKTSALILADAVLARALGWDFVVPLLALGLKQADLGKRGADLALACHHAFVTSASRAERLSADLARRAMHLKAIVPMLRAKGASDAVEVFLSRDAVAPVALPLPDRAARRLCDRLVDLGAVRELSGRGTFRLYGI